MPRNLGTDISTDVVIDPLCLEAEGSDKDLDCMGCCGGPGMGVCAAACVAIIPNTKKHVAVSAATQLVRASAMFGIPFPS